MLAFCTKKHRKKRRKNGEKSAPFAYINKSLILTKHRIHNYKEKHLIRGVKEARKVRKKDRLPYGEAANVC